LAAAPDRFSSSLTRRVENLSIACRIMVVTSRLSTPSGAGFKSFDGHARAIDRKSTPNRRLFHGKTGPFQSTQSEEILGLTKSAARGIDNRHGGITTAAKKNFYREYWREPTRTPNDENYL
jgi:hypothetical protein